MPASAGAGLLAGEPQRLHPASPVLDLILSARQWALPIVILSFGSAGSLVAGPLLFVALAALVAWKVVAWRRFSYRLANDVLTIEQGVFQRNRREVPLGRIQQVDLQRRLRHRVLGVAIVRIDTAGGGGGAEAVLEAIADDEAHALRTLLLRRAPAAAAASGEQSESGEVDDDDGSPRGEAAPTGPPVEVASLSVRDLALAGVSGSRLAAALPIALAAWGLLFELPGDVADDVLGFLPSGTGVFVLAAIIAVPFILVTAVASSILTDYGFTLVRVGSDLHLRRGLLDQREATLSLHRIQVLRVQENLVRRALGLCAVELQSAGSGTAAEGAVSRLTIPLVRTADLDALLALVLPAAVDRPELIPAPAAARRRAWVRRVLIPAAIVVAVAAFWTITTSGWAVLAALLVVPFVIGAELTYRNLGHVATTTIVVARGGGYVRTTSLVPVAKTQSTRLRSTWFQRRVGLATLSIDVAGRGSVPRVADGDARRLVLLRHEALNATAARADEDLVRRRARGAA